MENPVVSIIIPTYNYGHLISEALDSVLAQSFSSWECIIVDDGSTDDTNEVVKEYIHSNSQYFISYHRIDNSGTSIAKNHGIIKAKGKYIQFLDADDKLGSDKLSSQVAILKETGAGLVFSESVFFNHNDSENLIAGRYPKNYLADETLDGEVLLKRLVVNNLFTISSPLVKTSLVFEAGLFKAELKNNEDWLLWFKVGLLSPNFIYDSNAGSRVYIRIHNISAMNNHMAMFLGETVVRKEMNSILSKHPDDSLTRYLSQLNSDLLSLHQIRSLKVLEGFRYIFKKFYKSPIANFSLLRAGCFKLSVRWYKYLRQL